MATTNYSWNLPTVGGSEDAWGTQLNANWTALDTLLGGTNATEFAILDGATVSTAELNLLDGVTWTLTDYNTLTATAAELNQLDGVTGKTGVDTTLVTGTAGSDGQYAQWNADGDIIGITIPTAVQATWEAGTDTTDALVSPAKVAAAVAAQTVGGSQTWQDVSGSRSTGTSYQNTTGKPIQVAVSVTCSGLQFFQVSSNNSTWLNVAAFPKSAGDDTQANAQIIIPDNYYYRIPSANVSSVTFWAELR